MGLNIIFATLLVAAVTIAASAPLNHRRGDSFELAEPAEITVKFGDKNVRVTLPKGARLRIVLPGKKGRSKAKPKTITGGNRNADKKMELCRPNRGSGGTLLDSTG